LVEFHVSVDREAVAAFFADAAPLTVRLHKSPIDPKA
jgi:hypothetical protein